MLILEGGQTRVNDDDYLVGPPELIAEVALGPESYDLHSKKHDYERYGVSEYLVLVVREKRAIWFVRDENNRFIEMKPAEDGILRSIKLPGLWLDAAAFFRGDMKRVQAVLNEGLQAPEYLTFAAARAPKRSWFFHCLIPSLLAILPPWHSTASFSISTARSWTPTQLMPRHGQSR